MERPRSDKIRIDLMQLRIDSKGLQEALESVKGSGVYAVADGTKKGVLGDFAFLTQTADELEVWNADVGFILKVHIPLLETPREWQGWSFATKDLSVNVTVRISEILPILKKFNGNITIEGGPQLTIRDSNGNKFRLNSVQTHPNLGVIQRVSLMNIMEEGSMPKFNNTHYEGYFRIDSKLFSETMKFCELVRSGIYTLDFNPHPNPDGVHLGISSSNRGDKDYEYFFTPITEILDYSGEAATVSFSGPIHNFFNHGTSIDFYTKDAFPILLIAVDRMLIKTPRVEE